MLAGPAEIVGGCFAELDRLEAYRLDLCGSLLGIVAVHRRCRSPAPRRWSGALIVAVGFTSCSASARRSRLVAGAVLVVLLGIETFAPRHAAGRRTTRSPPSGAPRPATPRSYINVNGIRHQRVTSADKRLRAGAAVRPAVRQRPQRNPLDDVLIVGAGSGTDVAVALQRGAKHVDAVEIDPKLLELGRRHNPDRPYADPRVTTDRRRRPGLPGAHRRRSYDLILFALPDSLTLVNGASSLRLESYLFTREAMASAREHLKPGGAFSMYNYYREPWLVDRLAGTLTEVFGHRPCLDLNKNAGQQAVITAGLSAADQSCAEVWSGAESADSASTPAPSTDDRPFLYLRDRALPGLYLLTLLLILLTSLLAVRVVAGPLRRMRPYADLFLLGAAFLLLETKSVTGFALLFGTTWVVNALVFTGVLLAVLAAVEVTRRWRTPPLPVMYGVLGGGLLLAWLVPGLVAARAAGGAEGGDRDRGGVPADLRGQRGVRQAVRRDRRADRGLRRQPARRDGRRLPGVRRADGRVQGPAPGGRPALRRGAAPAPPPRRRAPHPGRLIPGRTRRQNGRAPGPRAQRGARSGGSGTPCSLAQSRASAIRCGELGCEANST